MRETIVEEVVVEEAVAAEPPRRAPRPATIGQLRRERRRLWDERQEVVYHVGGLAVDLHARGVLDAGLLWHRAELVHELDARMALIDEQLAEIDTRRVRRRRAAQPVGYCLSCGAPYPDGAVFCSQCGARIPVPPAPGAPGDADRDTAVIAEGDTEVFAPPPAERP